MAESAIPRSVQPEGDDPLTTAIWRLRSRGCWTDAAALLAARAGEPDTALRLVELHVERCARTAEGWDRAEEALRAAESLPLDDEQRGAAASERGHLAYASTHFGVRDRTDEARSALGRAAALLDPASPARPLLDFRRGLMAQYLSDSPQDAEASYRRAHAEATARGDRLLTAASCHQLGTLELLSGEPGEARRLLAEALRLREEAGDLVGVALALQALADSHPPAEAARLRREATRLNQLLGLRPAAGMGAGASG